MKIRFVKLANKWYADLPDWNGSVDELEMVNGADTFLDKVVAQYKREVILEINDEYRESKYEFIFDGMEYEGANYVERNTGDKIWICNVTLTVFDKFPSRIYVDVMKD